MERGPVLRKGFGLGADGVRVTKQVKTKAHKKIAKRLLPELDTELRKQLDDGFIMVRWMACVDILASDGTRSLVSLVSPGMEPYEYDGMAENVPCPFQPDEEVFLDP